MSTLSVIQPVSVAIRCTRRILFEPFVLSKWLRLGFCSFLMGSLPLSSFGGTAPSQDSGSGQADFNADALLLWVQQHSFVVLLATVVVVALIIVLGVLFTWLSSRGRFMLLDGVVRNRGAIAAPWQEYRREANSLFRFRFGLGLLCILVFAITLAPPLAILLLDWMPGALAIRVVVFAGCVLALAVWILAMFLLSAVLLDFVVPVMYRERLPVLPAFSRVITHLVRQHPGSLALYLLARVVLQSLVGTLAMIVILLTCCIAIVPYLGSVILLPLALFEITYPLAFLEQLGPDWQWLPAQHQRTPEA